jgi:hypothetical protein
MKRDDLWAGALKIDPLAIPLRHGGCEQQRQSRYFPDKSKGLYQEVYWQLYGEPRESVPCGTDSGHRKE